MRNPIVFWFLLLPMAVLLLVQLYPALYTVLLSLEQRIPKGWIFVGLKNFRLLIQTTLFQDSVGYTIVFLVGYVSLTMVIGFITALLLNSDIGFKSVYITLLFIPWVIAQILAGLIFRLLVLPDYGLLAGILQNPSLFPPNGISVLTNSAPTPWFGNFPFPPAPAMTLLIIASTWRALPFVMILLLAAMQTVPHEIVESARIDGANGWQVNRYIRIPLMLPTMVVAIFNLIISGVNGVGIIFSLTSGGPGTSTSILSYVLYSIGWIQLNFGSSAALAMIMAVFNWLLIAATLRVTRVQSEGESNAT